MLALLDRAIEIAPGFALAMAAHADLSVRRWFLPAGQNDSEVARLAHESVARASAGAAQVPLTHYAAGRLAVSDGRFGDAARELTLALALAYAGQIRTSVAGPSLLALGAALVGMLLGQLIRGRVRAETFRLWFFIGLLLLGSHLALGHLL